MSKRDQRVSNMSKAKLHKLANDDKHPKHEAAMVRLSVLKIREEKLKERFSGKKVIA